MGHEIHQRRKALSIGEQIGRMSKYPQLEATLRRNIVEWIGPWSPSALSDTYLISVSYQFLCRPKVSILSPDLKLAAGKKSCPTSTRPANVTCVCTCDGSGVLDSSSRTRSCHGRRNGSRSTRRGCRRAAGWGKVRTRTGHNTQRSDRCFGFSRSTVEE